MFESLKAFGNLLEERSVYDKCERFSLLLSSCLRFLQPGHFRQEGSCLIACCNFGNECGIRFFDSPSVAGSVISIAMI